MAPKAKLSLKRLSQKSAKFGPVRKVVTKAPQTNKREYTLGRVLRSCLASVDAMAETPDDYKADSDVLEPTTQKLFKGCIAAVQATIDYEPEAEFRISDDEGVENAEEKAERISETKTEDTSEVDAGSETEEEQQESMADDKKNDEHVNVTEDNENAQDSVTSCEIEKRPRGRPRRDVDVSQASEIKAGGRRGRGKLTGTAEQQPTDESPEKAAAAVEQEEVPDTSPETVEALPKRGRGRPKRSSLPPIVGDNKPDDETRNSRPVRRGRSHKIDAELTEPEDEQPDSPQPRRRGRPKTTTTTNDAKNESSDQSDKAIEDTQVVQPRKRGRPRVHAIESVSENVDAIQGNSNEDDLPPENSTSKSSNDVQPSQEIPEIASADEVKPKRGRGRPPMSEDAKQAKLQQKNAIKSGKGKKSVLKVALPIRPRSLRSQPEKPEDSDTEEVATQNPEAESSSPKTSPRAVRTVRVNVKKKPARSSRGSDTDTAEETLDEEEHLRLLEKSNTTSKPCVIFSGSPSTTQQARTIAVRLGSPKAVLPEEPKVKKLKPDDDRSKVIVAPTIVVTKTNRKRKVDGPEVVQQPDTASKISAIIGAPAKKIEVSAGVSKPTVTVVSPMIISKPGVTIVSPQTLQKSITVSSSSQVGSGAKPIVITVPSNGMRSSIGNVQGMVKTIVMPVTTSTTKPTVNNVTQMRSIRISSPGTAPRTVTTQVVQRPAIRVIPSPTRPPGTSVSPATGGPMVMRTVPAGSLAPRLITTGGVRPSIIRGPRIVTTTMGGTVRPRVISNFPGNARIVHLRPGLGATMQPARPGFPVSSANKVIVKTVAPVLPQRHITVQATPSLQTTTTSVPKTTTPIVVSRPPAVVVRTQTQPQPPKIIVKSPQVIQQPVKKVQQVVKPVERKPPPKKVVSQPRKPNATVTTTSTSESTSAVEKLLQEPQLPKVGKKPLTKKQKSMRKTDLIKTSTRSRRRGTDLQIDYNEDRLGGQDDSDSVEESPHSDPEASPAEEIEQPQEAEVTGPQEDIPVAVVEVFLSQDEVKLREVHSPTKQDLVELTPQTQQQQQSSTTSGDAPEGFFTTEGGYVEGIDSTFAVRTSPQKGLVSSSNNAFAKALMVSDDHLKKKISKRKSNPLAKD